MSRDWTAAEDNIIRWMSRVYGVSILWGHKTALAREGFRRSVPEIRTRLRDLDLLATRAPRRRTAT